MADTLGNTSYATLLIDGVDIASICDCVTSLDGLYDVGTTRGDNVEISGVDGEFWVDKPMAYNQLDLGIMFNTKSQIELNDKFRALKRLLQPGKLLELERHTTFSTGSEAHFATGELATALQMTTQVLRFGRMTLGIRVHQGIWTGDTYDFTVAGDDQAAYQVVGEYRTGIMNVTMDPGTTLTNLTNGFILSNTAPTWLGSVVVNTADMTATQGLSDVSGLLDWTGSQPFRLEAGENLLLVSDGTALITYTAVYL
jgi:hypothetical protein